MTTRKAITSIALIHAKHCDGRCKALQERMQSFAWVVAKLCVRKLKNLLKGGSLSFAKKQVDKSTSCYSYSLSLTITRNTNNLSTRQLVN